MTACWGPLGPFLAAFGGVCAALFIASGLFLLVGICFGEDGMAAVKPLGVLFVIAAAGLVIVFFLGYINQGMIPASCLH